MKNTVLNTVIGLLFILSAVASDDNDFNELCDFEGSGADDCPDTHCCKQTECDLLFNPNKNPDKRCCSKSERQQDPVPNDCTMCTECCDESERKQIPLPDHCSKCPRCIADGDHSPVKTISKAGSSTTLALIIVAVLVLVIVVVVIFFFVRSRTHQHDSLPQVT